MWRGTLWERPTPTARSPLRSKPENTFSQSSPVTFDLVNSSASVYSRNVFIYVKFILRGHVIGWWQPRESWGLWTVTHAQLNEVSEEWVELKASRLKSPKVSLMGVNCVFAFVRMKAFGWRQIYGLHVWENPLPSECVESCDDNHI